jgi:hypothetical protein
MALAHGGSLGTASISSGGSSGTLSTANTVSSGGKLIVSFSGWDNGGSTQTTSSVSGGGLTWTLREGFRYPADSYVSVIFTADAPSGLAASTTLTVTLGHAIFGGQIAGAFITGAADETSPIDVASGAQGTGTNNTVATVALTTTNADDYIYYHTGCDFGGSASFTPTTSYTEISDFVNGGDGFGASCGFRIVSATGSQTAGATAVSGHPAWVAAIAIKASGGGGGGGTAAKELAMLGVG